MTGDADAKAQKLRDVLREIFGQALSERQIEALVERALREAQSGTGR